MRINRYLALAAGLCVILGIVFVALFGRRVWNRLTRATVSERPLPISTERIVTDNSYSDVMFLHHSTGAYLIVGGSVRELMTQRGYRFWDHDYNNVGLTRPDGTQTGTSYDIPELEAGAQGGGNTDPEGLAALFAQPVHDPPDNAFSRLLQHRVLIFKSCFPNSAINSDEMLAERKVLYLGMRGVIDQHPDRAFILMTSPPLHPNATNPDEAKRARALANWMAGEWKSGHANLFVFDFFDQLADHETHMLRADYQLDPKSDDSHPNSTANRAIGPMFVDFVDRAVQAYRSGLTIR